MSENLQGFSGNEFQLSIPKTKAVDVQESGIGPKAAPHGRPTSHLGPISSSRPWQILSQGFHKSFSSPSRGEAAWLLHLFLSGKQQRQCCARNVAGFELNFTPCLLESAKTLFSWAGQEGGKKTQRGHSGNNYKYRIMGISSHLTPLSQQSQVIPELNISCNSASGLWDSGKRDLWFGFLT